MNTKYLGRMQKNILKLLSVDGAHLTYVFDTRDLSKDFYVHYDSEMIGDDCGDSFTITEQQFQQLVKREGMFQRKNHPSSLEIEVECYELTDEAKRRFR